MPKRFRNNTYFDSLRALVWNESNFSIELCLISWKVEWKKIEIKSKNVSI